MLTVTMVVRIFLSVWLFFVLVVGVAAARRGNTNNFISFRRVLHVFSYYLRYMFQAVLMISLDFLCLTKFLYWFQDVVPPNSLATTTSALTWPNDVTSSPTALTEKTRLIAVNFSLHVTSIWRFPSSVVACG